MMKYFSLPMHNGAPPDKEKTTEGKCQEDALKTAQLGTKSHEDEDTDESSSDSSSPVTEKDSPEQEITESTTEEEFEQTQEPVSLPAVVVNQRDEGAAPEEAQLDDKEQAVLSNDEDAAVIAAWDTFEPPVCVSDDEAGRDEASKASLKKETTDKAEQGSKELVPEQEGKAVEDKEAISSDRPLDNEEAMQHSTP